MADRDRTPAKRAGHGGPARGYSWPPFQPGHALRMTHGAYVSVARLSKDERTSEIAEFVADTQPVAHPSDATTIWQLAICLRRIELAAAALDQADQATADDPLGAYEDGRQPLERLRADMRGWIMLAQRLEQQLARTPEARGRLGVNLAEAQSRQALTEHLRTKYGMDVAADE